MKKLSLLKPTTEALKMFDDLLQAQHRADTIRKMRVAHEKLEDLKSKWDWSNILVKDETSGKYGVKDVAGTMLVATEYDEIGYLGNYDPEHYCATIAVRDGNKWGFIHADGTGQFACDTIFDHLERIPSTNLYSAKWGGKTDTVGIVNNIGLVVVPNILTKIGDVNNGVIRIEKDGKVGAVSCLYSKVVMPQYDSWTIDNRWNVLFKKGRTEGYISISTGLFIPKSRTERRDYIGLGDFFMADCEC